METNKMEIFSQENWSQRRRELQRKENAATISPDEQFELNSLRAFPDNPRAAGLLRRQFQGFTSENEDRELAKHFQKEQDSSEVQKLRERLEAGDPNIEFVAMNGGKAIEVWADSEEEKVIWTNGLGGCYGIVIFCEDANGNRWSAVTHYSPLKVSENLRKLDELIGIRPEMKGSKIKQTVFILTAGEEKDELQKKQINVLELSLKLHLGDNLEIKKVPYPVKKFMTKDWGTCIVRIPPYLKGRASYRTWFSGGNLGGVSEKSAAAAA